MQQASATPKAIAALSRLRRQRIAHSCVVVSAFVAFSAVGAKLVALGLTERPLLTLAAAEPVATSFSRPDIIDRNGRLLATDLEVPSLFADPMLVIDRDEVVEKLATVLPEIDQAKLRADLADKTRRFVWVRRGVSPAVAQKVHDLGLPGLAFRGELRRAYPAGKLAGHVLGSVDIDNRALGGIEAFIDKTVGVDPVHAARLSTKPPVRLTLDVGVQHALEDELDTAISRYHTSGAAGLVMDIATGEVLASASFPRADPYAPASKPTANDLDKISGGTFELGSVFKILTVAMALDEGIAKPSTPFDVREPLQAGRFTITDFHVASRPLTTSEIFTHSSNVGAGMLALATGGPRMKAFFSKLGLLTPMGTEAGAVSQPQLPRAWERAEIVTMSYGHGLAVAPLQFAAAAATVLGGGARVVPVFTRIGASKAAEGQVVTPETRRQMANLLRLNVTADDGTGKRADVTGYRIGGKTGTADLAALGGYKTKAVISSFLGAFPMDNPRYLTFVLLFEPKATEETGGQRTASTNAAPVTARLVARIAPQLGVIPQATIASN